MVETRFVEAIESMVDATGAAHNPGLLCFFGGEAQRFATAQHQARCFLKKSPIDPIAAAKLPPAMRYVLEADDGSALVDTTGACCHAELDPMATFSRLTLSFDGPGGYDSPIEVERPEPLFSSVEQAGIDGSFTPLLALLSQAKRFDDCLIVRIEQLAHARSIDGPGLLAALETLRGALPKGKALGLLEAARSLLGEEIEQFGPDALHAKKYLREFEADPKRSKPLGAWTQSQRLRDLFRHDRLLQGVFRNDLADIFRRAFLEVPEAQASYAKYLSLQQVLTGPPVVSPVTEPWSGDEEQQFALLPAADSHESRVVRELFGDASVPEGFKLMDELIARIRDGRLDTTPNDDPSWYQHQQHAAAALLAPETAGLTVGERYQRTLDDAFKAFFASNRESHVKQLDLAAAGGGMPFYVVPEFSIEPLPEHYARVASAYRQLRLGLRRVLGTLLLETAQFETRGDFGAPNVASVDEAIRSQELLFLGAELISRDELGQLVPDDPQSAAARIHFRSWQALSPRAPALASDVRVAAPVYYDRDRQRTRIAVVLGLRKQRLEFTFTTPPKVELFGVNRSPQFSTSSQIVLSPVTLECDVRRIPNREELRAICDREQTPEQIREALEGA